MDKPDGPLEIGRIVLSKRGRDKGVFYVVVGFSEGGRLALADADHFNVTRPKKKNPRHVQVTSRWAAELVDLIEKGKDIDRGRFSQILGQG